MATRVQAPGGAAPQSDTLVNSRVLTRSPLTSDEFEVDGLEGRSPTPTDFSTSAFQENFAGVPVSSSSMPLVQPKLVVGPANDKYEQEADRVADQVMGMPEPVGLVSPNRAVPAPQKAPGLQRQSIESESMSDLDDDEDLVQTKALGPTPFISQALGADNPLQRETLDDDDDELVQMKAAGAATAIASPTLTSQLGQGGGHPLPSPTRHFMETRFGHDFGGVRVHSDNRAAQLNRGLNAQAFTHGHHVYFGQGQYKPQTHSGQKLLAHELTHVVQQQAQLSSSMAQPDFIQRREINPSLWWRIRNTRNPQDWYMSDRMGWQRASVGGTIALLSGSNTFIQACIYNTQNLRPQEYQNVEQRHNYYDLISYVIEHDPNTPAAARGVRFFHATTLVTGSPGIGTVDSPLGAMLLQQETRVILREVNEDLFGANMAIIRNLLLNWREPRSPSHPTGAVSAFEFDLQMVEYEQGRVENYIQRNQARFTSGVVTDINDTLDPNGFGQSFNPSQQNFQWAMQSLGVSRLDFTQREHRIAIGIAAVHLFHRKTLQEYLTHMRQRTPVLQP